jgi:hypothetical protein
MPRYVCRTLSHALILNLQCSYTTMTCAQISSRVPRVPHAGPYNIKIAYQRARRGAPRFILHYGTVPLRNWGTGAPTIEEGSYTSNIKCPARATPNHVCWLVFPQLALSCVGDMDTMYADFGQVSRYFKRVSSIYSLFLASIDFGRTA